MLQRVQEIKPGFTMAQLVALLQSVPVAQNKYYIFPVYHTADLTDPQMQIAPQGGSLPQWLNVEAPDGLGAAIGNEPPLQDDPNYNWENIVGGKSPNGKHWVDISGTVGWQPGTGVGGCLGNLLVARQSDCYFTGEP
jgi:hypothetical protein